MMVTPEWVRLMAAYNAEMNARFYAAAATLPAGELARDRGAFFGSIQATLNHLLWADRVWMARFAGWPKPAGGIGESVGLHAAFSELAEARRQADGGIVAWAAALTPAALEGELRWFSGAAQREVSRPRGLLVAHLFNHQTHHRGQVHAMLTAAGARTGDTDLWLVPG